MSDPALLQSIKSILKDSKAQQYDPEVESMLLDFATGLTAQLAMRASTLRAGLGGATITESIMQAACAIVEGESFEPPMTLEDIQAEADAINSKPLLLTSAPILQLPPPESRLTAAEFELRLASSDDATADQVVAVREMAPEVEPDADARSLEELDRAIAASLGKAARSQQPPRPQRAVVAPTAPASAQPPPPSSAAATATHAASPSPPVVSPPVPVSATAPIANGVSATTASSSSNATAAQVPLAPAAAEAGQDGDAPRFRTVAGFPAGSVLERVPSPPPA